MQVATCLLRLLNLSLHTYFDKLNMTTRTGRSEPVEDCALFIYYRSQLKLIIPYKIRLGKIKVIKP